VRIKGWSFSAHALVVNSQIEKKAIELLPEAQVIAKAKVTRVKFFQRSRESLGLEDTASFQRAEQEAAEASLRLETLVALSKGKNAVRQATDWC
jgi:hypothetical protein